MKEKFQKLHRSHLMLNVLFMLLSRKVIANMTHTIRTHVLSIMSPKENAKHFLY